MAGIDVGNESHFVAVAPGRDPQPVREFSSWTASLAEMCDWLKARGVESVVMRGFKVCLANARSTKNLPGRKTDVQENQWLLKLHTYGLPRDSFRPPGEVRALRSLGRLRDRHVREPARAVQHMRKSMITMNVQLSNAISGITGTTGQAIIRAILAGERDARKLAKFRDRRIKATEDEVARSLEGTWREDMLFELRQAVDAYDFIRNQIVECDRRLQVLIGGLQTREVQAVPIPAEAAAGPPSGKKKSPGKSKNVPTHFDLASELTRVCGVNLISIDGIDIMTAQTIVPELGTDFSLSPSRDVSGGKVVKQESRKVRNRVATALRNAANSLFSSKSYLGARYRALRTRLGSPKAIKAMARYLACLVHGMFTHGQAWVDRGARQFEDKRAEREMAVLQRKAAALGFQLVSQGGVSA